MTRVCLSTFISWTCICISAGFYYSYTAIDCWKATVSQSTFYFQLERQIIHFVNLSSRVAKLLCVILICRSLFVLLSFFFCLSFFDLQITPLVSSISSVQCHFREWKCSPLHLQYICLNLLNYSIKNITRILCYSIPTKVIF